MYFTKSLKKFFSLTLIGGLIFSSAPLCSSLKVSATSNTDKIHKKLQDVIDSSVYNETIPVQVIYNDLNHLTIDNELKKRTNMKVSDYNTRDSFKANVIPIIIKETEQKYGYELSHIMTLIDEQTNEKIYCWDNYDNSISPFMTNKKISTLKKETIISALTEPEKQYLSEECFGMSLIGKNISENIDNYVDIRRDCVTDVYREYNSNFADKYDIKNDDIIFLAGFAPTIIANVDKNTIKQISQDPNVISINLYENLQTYNSLSDACDITDVSTLQGNGYNSGTGYTGANVKVGIIESDGRYNSSSLMLNNTTNLQYVQNGNINSDVNTHASIVTSILKGKSVNYNGNTYRGVAPDAITYQTSSLYSNDFFDAIETLALNYNVSIINTSLNFYGVMSDYSSIDWTVDEYIKNYGIVFVTSTGNVKPENQYVCAPANAYNTIAVGNVYTGNSSPYPMNTSSMYLRRSNVYPNKPDVCAPGSMYIPGYGSYTGTSLSSPLVAGIAAQLLQCDPTLKLPDSSNNGKTYYNAVKALIIFGCERTCLQDMSNVVFGSDSSLLINNKCGAGMVNAKNSIDALLFNNADIKNINMTVNGTSVGGMGIYAQFRAGTKIKAVLVFSKIDQTSNNNIDLNIYDSSLNNLKTSSSPYSNVEIVEYIVPTTGNYMIMADMCSVSFSDEQTLPGALLIYTD